MIYLQSDYSPVGAPRELEIEFQAMVTACLFLAGMSTRYLHTYAETQTKANQAFAEALGEPTHEKDGERYHTEEEIIAAQDAVKGHINELHSLLATEGITLFVDKVDENEHHFALSRTTVYLGYSNMRPIAIIHRPMTPSEAELFKPYYLGHRAEHAKAAN